jgi:hypothetical protein
MRFLWMSLGLTAIVSQGVGCVAETGEPGAGDPAGEPVGVISQAQLDGGTKGYNITQSGATVASAWAGSAGGVPVEYWVAKSSYSPSTARGFTGASQTCSDWKRGVCGAGWSGSTYYQAIYTQTTLDCAFPPGPCSPAPGAISFLGSGSYKTSTVSIFGGGTPYAWTYVSGSCEYWAMNHTISNGNSQQNVLSPAYTSLSQFESSVCAMGTVPSTFYSVYYEPVANFCSITTC